LAPLRPGYLNDDSGLPGWLHRRGRAVLHALFIVLRRLFVFSGRARVPGLLGSTPHGHYEGNQHQEENDFFHHIFTDAPMAHFSAAS
jgi:hypothetical protein